MPPVQEALVILVDYKTTTLRTNPSLCVGRKVRHSPHTPSATCLLTPVWPRPNIVQQHYVETLGRALVVNLPALLNFFWKDISPFLDPVTRDKMRFNPNLLELILSEQLDADFGGDYEFVFEKETYWSQILKCRLPFSCDLLFAAHALCDTEFVGLQKMVRGSRSRKRWDGFHPIPM
jgi:CRAL/TRIO domain